MKRIGAFLILLILTFSAFSGEVEVVNGDNVAVDLDVRLEGQVIDRSMKFPQGGGTVVFVDRITKGAVFYDFDADKRYQLYVDTAGDIEAVEREADDVAVLLDSVQWEWLLGVGFTIVGVLLAQISVQPIRYW